MKIVALLMLILGLIYCGNARAESPATRPGGVVVVKTYGDLLKQPVITLKSGAKVRLGIETDKPVVPAGLLVYCLTETNELKSGSGEMDSRLGPLEVQVRRKDERLHARELSKWMIQSEKDSGEMLYVKSIYFPVAGEYRVTINDLDKDLSLVVREMTLTAEKSGQKVGEPSWLMFDHEKLLHKRRKGEAETVVNSLKLGLPRWEGYRPITAYRGKWDGKAVERKPEDLLPTCMPTEPDKGLKLKVEGDLFSIESEEGMLGLPVTGYWLARWWVNDKPVNIPIGRAKAESLNERMDSARLIERDKPFQFHVKIDPGALGAKKGDTIAVQLLFCSMGVQLIHNQDRLQNLAHMIINAPPVRMTNRVEFVLP